MEELFSIRYLENAKIRKFTRDYFSMVDELDWYLLNKKESRLIDSSDKTVLPNLDLWIECYISIFPDLINFRKKLHDYLESVGVHKHSPYCYEESNNHYYRNNQRFIIELRSELLGECSD